MQEHSAVARFYDGTTFGPYRFKTIRGLPGIFLESVTGYPADVKTFPLEPGQDFADIKINELIDLFYTPKIVQKSEKSSDRIQFIPANSVPPQKPRYINIIRYARPFRDDEEINSSEGVTFYFQLDYRLRRVKFGHAVCKGDNFSKREGTDRAHLNFDADPKFFDMEDGPNPIMPCGVMKQLYVKHAHLLDIECRRQLKNYFNHS